MRRSHSGRVHWSLAQPAGRAGPSLPDPRRIPAAGGPRPCPPRPRRPLVYGALSGLLAVVYLSGVVLLQGLFRALTGQESNLAIVVATLPPPPSSSPSGAACRPSSTGASTGAGTTQPPRWPPSRPTCATRWTWRA